MALVILRSWPEEPLPAGLREGDRIDARRMSLRERSDLTALSVAADSTIALPVLRRSGDGGMRIEPVLMRARADDDQGGYRGWQEWPVALFGLLLLWRGRDWVAGGVAMLLLALACMPPLLYSSLAPTTSSGLRLLVEYVVRPVAAMSLPVVMISMLAGRAPRLRRAILIVYAAIFAMFLAERLVIDVPWFASGVVLWGSPAHASLPFAYAMMGSFLIFAPLMYRQVDIVMRLRARWVLIGIVLYIVSLLDIIVFRHDALWLAPYTLSTMALAYATLRHKLVSASFAISRTVVYGVVAALIVGVFAVVERAIAAFAMGKNAGLALHLGVPLVLGILVHRLHGKVEHVVERLFFRQRFLAEQRLDRLAQESAYLTQPGPLVARTLRDVASTLQTPRVALYWRDDARGGYRRRGQQGEPAWPRYVDADDPAFVSLRAGEASAALQSGYSPLGQGGIAFPMSVAGQLRGAIVCGERTSQYAPDERRQMGRVAHDVGVALHALGPQASEERMVRLLDGRLTVEGLRRETGLANGTG